MSDAKKIEGLQGDAAARKAAPIASGVLFYFPNALAAVANLSHRATEQHHPGEPMHWDYAKSSDEADCITRHLAQSGTIDTDGVLHSTKVAWRALANLERELLEANPEMQPGRNVRNFSRSTAPRGEEKQRVGGFASSDGPDAPAYVPQVGDSVRVIGNASRPIVNQFEGDVIGAIGTVLHSWDPEQDTWMINALDRTLLDNTDRCIRAASDLELVSRRES